MTRCPHRFARRIRTTTVAGLVPLLLLASLPACATRSSRPAVSADGQPTARPLSDWSRVEAVPVGTQTEVRLYDHAAPAGSRRVTGRFHAATADTLTLALDDGSRRTLAQSAVHSVHIHRPIRNRYAGWLTLVGVAWGVVSNLLSVDVDLALGPRPARVARDHIAGTLLIAALSSVSASVPGFLLQRWQRIYEVPPAASRLITQVDVPVADGDAVPRSGEVTVSVFHAIQAARPGNETLGLTVCLSSHPTRCTGRRVVFEERAQNLSSPRTATLGFSDETVPADTPLPIYVHVVLITGSSWRPPPDQAVPQLGDPGVLDVETVTRRITVVDR